MPRDYVLRLIDQVALMLATIVAKRKAGQTEEARRDIEEQALQHTGLPLKLVRGAPPTLISELLRTSGELRFIRGVLLAELLYQDAQIAEECGDKPGAFSAYLHTWWLLYDAAISFSTEERIHFGERQEHARTRLIALAGDLGVTLAEHVPPAFFAAKP